MITGGPTFTNEEAIQLRDLALAELVAAIASPSVTVDPYDDPSGWGYGFLVTVKSETQVPGVPGTFQGFQVNVRVGANGRLISPVERSKKDALWLETNLAALRRKSR